MEDLLFSNIGGRIKTVAKVTAYIEMGSAVLGGVIMFFAALSDMEELLFLLLMIPVIVMIGCFLAWLSSILLYGFGELIETNSQIRNNTAILAKPVLREENRVHQEQAVAQARAKQTASQNRGMNNPAAPQYVPPMNPIQSTKYCPNCGEPQSKGGSHCWACGQKIDP